MNIVWMIALVVVIGAGLTMVPDTILAPKFKNLAYAILVVGICLAFLFMFAPEFGSIRARP